MTRSVTATASRSRDPLSQLRWSGRHGDVTVVVLPHSTSLNSLVYTWRAVPFALPPPDPRQPPADVHAYQRGHSVSVSIRFHSVSCPHVIPVVTHGRTPFLVARWHSAVCGHIFTHLSVRRSLGCPHVTATLSNAAVTLGDPSSGQPCPPLQLRTQKWLWFQSLRGLHAGLHSGCRTLPFPCSLSPQLTPARSLRVFHPHPLGPPQLGPHRFPGPAGSHLHHGRRVGSRKRTFLPPAQF